MFEKGRSLTATVDYLGKTDKMTQFLRFGRERRINVSHKTRDLKLTKLGQIGEVGDEPAGMYL